MKAVHECIYTLRLINVAFLCLTSFIFVGLLPLAENTHFSNVFVGSYGIPVKMHTSSSENVANDLSYCSLSTHRLFLICSIHRTWKSTQPFRTGKDLQCAYVCVCHVCGCNRHTYDNLSHPLQSERAEVSEWFDVGIFKTLFAEVTHYYLPSENGSTDQISSNSEVSLWTRPVHDLYIFGAMQLLNTIFSLVKDARTSQIWRTGKAGAYI